MKRVLSLFFVLMILTLLIVPVCSALTTDMDYIYFAVPSSESVAWTGFSQIYCHIWSKDSGELYPWQYEKEACEDLHNGYWRYNISNIKFDPADEYSLIFSADNGMQTYDLHFTSSCRGDVVCCDGTNEKNPINSEKNCFVARWRYNGAVERPVIEVDDSGAVTKLSNSTADVSWGDYWGNSYELAETVAATESVGANNQDETTRAEKIASEKDGLNTRAVTVWIVIACAAIMIAVASVTIYLARKNHHS